MKNTALKKLQFATLLAITSFVGIQESHAYRITCPAAGKLKMEKPRSDELKFYGEATNENGAPIKLESQNVQWEPRNGPFDPKDMTYDYHSINNVQLECNYATYTADGRIVVISLHGNLPAGVNCQSANMADNYVDCH